MPGAHDLPSVPRPSPPAPLCCSRGPAIPKSGGRPGRSGAEPSASPGQAPSPTPPPPAPSSSPPPPSPTAPPSLLPLPPPLLPHCSAFPSLSPRSSGLLSPLPYRGPSSARPSPPAPPLLLPTRLGQPEAGSSLRLCWESRRAGREGCEEAMRPIPATRDGAESAYSRSRRGLGKGIRWGQDHDPSGRAPERTDSAALAWRLKSCVGWNHKLLVT